MFSKKDSIKVRLVRTNKELEQVYQIREIVFINEQKVPKHLEKDEFDATAKHVIVLHKSKTIGCARVRFIGTKGKIERIAILKEFRSKGAGKKIVNYLISYCKRKKAKEIIVGAQYRIKDFYAKFGFKEKGKTFQDAGIKHIKMVLKT